MVSDFASGASFVMIHHAMEEESRKKGRQIKFSTARTCSEEGECWWVGVGGIFFIKSWWVLVCEFATLSRTNEVKTKVFETSADSGKKE